MRVCILGCGPAGLLASYAIAQYGGKVSIVSRKVKSKIPGAVFLHEQIPFLTTLPDGKVMFIKHGTKEGYAGKVYGNQDADCSWDLFPEGERPAWSMFSLYDRLWEWYEDRIDDHVVTHDDIEPLTQMYDLVISTIPASNLCRNPKHEFKSQEIYVLNKSVDTSIENVIIYNGNPKDAWYRTSNLFGSEATESAHKFTDSFIFKLGASMSRGYKPISTDCNCNPRIRRIGRYGRWEKGILVHHAYKQTVQLMEELE